MIRYDLNCDNGHEFDGWFKNSDAFDQQQQKSLVTCPFCGSHDVKRALMTPNVQGTRKSKDVSLPVPTPAQTPQQTQPSSQIQSQPQQSNPVAPAQKISAAQLAKATEELQKHVEIIREFRKHVVANSEDVGDNFAEEARKIHYEEIDPRSIRGHATPKQAQELKEEGVDFIPLPKLPEDMN